MPTGEVRISDPVDLTPDAGTTLVEQQFDVSVDGATVVTGRLVPDELGFACAT